MPALGTSAHVTEQHGPAFSAQGASKVSHDQLLRFLAAQIDSLTHLGSPVGMPFLITRWTLPQPKIEIKHFFGRLRKKVKVKSDVTVTD